MPASENRKQKRKIQQAKNSGVNLTTYRISDLSTNIQQPAQLEQYRSYYRYITYAEAITRIKWHNLPEEIDARFLEMNLFYYGQATISHIKGEYLAQMSNPYDLYDKQQNYDKWVSISALGEVNYNTQKNGVMIYDNQLRVSPIEILTPLIEDCAQAMTTASSNLIQQRYGVFFTASKNNQKDAKRLSQMLGMGEVGAVTVKGFENNLGVQTINTGVGDVTETAFSSKKEYLNEIHSFLGTDFIPHEKKERLISDEAQASLDKVNRQREFFLEPRRKACDQMNKLFNWNVWVEWATDEHENKNVTHETQDENNQTVSRETMKGDDNNDNITN